MAEIYRAKTFDPDGGVHLVAVKRVLAHLVEDDEFIQMLIDEAKIASLLRHPNIAFVYEFARSQGEYFIAMEYVDGKDTRTILERCRATSQPLPLEHAVWIAAEMGKALHAAHCVLDPQGHALRLVHRDVSPSNVLVSYGGEVKLCDFGIAKATLSRVQTKTGVIKGKVKYMSPEQATGRKLDHRSDIFSLGSVLYELLTRVPPFTASTEMDLLVKVRDARYTKVRELEPDVPPALEAIVDRALARSRQARYQSADEMSMDLAAFLADHAPGYTSTRLARYIRQAFAREIEKELRVMEEYVVAEPDITALGENLIADVQGPDAPYSKFTPIAQSALTGSTSSVAPAPEPLGDLPTQIIDRGAAPYDPTLHSAETCIIDLSVGTRERSETGPPPIPDDVLLLADEPTRIIRPARS